MSDPPAGGPEPPLTNTQETHASFSVEDFQPRVSIDTGQIIGKRTRNGEAYTPTEGTGRITTREVWKLIDNLKDIIHRQTTLIESTKADLEEVKHDQNVLREQNDRLHEEVRALRAQIEASPQPNPPRTWAAIAASGTSDPHPSLQRPEKDQKRTRTAEGNSFGRYLSTDSANTYIRSALLSAPSTQDAQVAGIGTTKTGYLIRFKDSGSAETARNNTEWLNELGNNTKLVKPRFGIVVHRTPTENFDLEYANSQAIQRIMEENDLAEQGFQIEELAWLKRKDKALGKFASLGIWFDSAEGAEYILNNGLLVGQRYIGSVERREIKKKRKHHAVDIVRVNTSGNDAPQGSGPDAWIAAANTQLLNIMKSGPRMEALINDHQTQNLDVLVIQEPSITTYQTHVNHSAWRLYRPTLETDADRFRSLIYVNQRISTSSHRQILCDHPDIAAIKIWTADTQLLLFSVYIPSVPLRTPDDASAEPAFTAIQNTITAALRDGRRSTSVVLAGDFNRHHPTWGGNHIQPRLIEEASDLITFFQANGLYSCLPRGTATYWALNDPGRNSTIDQTVTNRPDLLIKCHLYHDNYGSDHRATYSEWNLQAQYKPVTKARKAFDRAEWNKIGEEVLRQIGPRKEIKTRPALDDMVQKLIEATTAAVNRYTPDVRPTPYSKRWFTPDLKVQQTKANQLRRKWQESCAQLGREHSSSITLFREMQEKRRA
ncbi:hypothetical protein CBS147333_10276 [Penicillium roqueforti]|nr:hypothetical protein CBS147333_10276 [Penicillium roqueforti]KAI3187018.1 hypothetical protein CBS147311_10237 [Penicillium roqueforti]KAI3260323.1 hypothetical protein CBS147308_10261 [Penicillium roqueforti]KAI3275247.1 hypothetical protein DTO003C3_10267 [Penicillium roqueforti]